jgi:hypothetical protein
VIKMTVEMVCEGVERVMCDCVMHMFMHLSEQAGILRGRGTEM